VFFWPLLFFFFSECWEYPSQLFDFSEKLFDKKRAISIPSVNNISSLPYLDS